MTGLAHEGRPVIPAEAVEAAWWAMPKDSYVDTREHVRTMLEAAAPHLTNAAKSEAWEWAADTIATHQTPGDVLEPDGIIKWLRALAAAAIV